MEREKASKESIENTSNQAQSVLTLDNSIQFTEPERESDTESIINRQSTPKIEEQAAQIKTEGIDHQLEAELDSISARTSATFEHILHSFNSETSLYSKGKTARLKGRPTSVQSKEDIEMSSDSEIDWLLDEDDDDEDSEPPTPAGVDSIEAKRDFLKDFEIPSLSDISEDFTETNAVTSNTDINKGQLTESEFLSDDDEAIGETDFNQKPPAGGDSIKAKTDFLKFFEIPSLSDISED